MSNRLIFNKDGHTGLVENRRKYCHITCFQLIFYVIKSNRQNVLEAGREARVLQTFVYVQNKINDDRRTFGRRSL